jgi:hypothetical protein
LVLVRGSGLHWTGLICVRAWNRNMTNSKNTNLGTAEGWQSGGPLGGFSSSEFTWPHLFLHRTAWEEAVKHLLHAQQPSEIGRRLSIPDSVPRNIKEEEKKEKKRDSCPPACRWASTSCSNSTVAAVTAAAELNAGGQPPLDLKVRYHFVSRLALLLLLSLMQSTESKQLQLLA